MSCTTASSIVISNKLKNDLVSIQALNNLHFDFSQTVARFQITLTTLAVRNDDTLEIQLLGA